MTALVFALLLAAPSPPDSVETAWAEKGASNGYVVEVAVPWAALGVSPRVGARVGFDVHATDADAPGGSREAKRVWAGTPGERQHRDPSAFGAVRLAERAGPASAAVPDVARASARPTIDGDASDEGWRAAVPFALAHTRLADADPPPGDLSATARVLWDQAALYVLVDVTDDRIVVDSRDAAHLDDNVEVYVDGGGEGESEYDANDLVVRIRPGRAAPDARRTYAGRSPSAPWRAAADARIREHRTAPLAVTVVDAGGRPVPGATVEVRQTRHAFAFGSALTGKWLADTTADGRRYREMARDLFNAAVLENDLKWNPWERQAAGGNETYRTEWTDAALDTLAGWGVPVRGHYLLWGDVGRFQPSRFFDAEGAVLDPPAFLAATMAHVEEKLAWTRGRVREWDAVNHPARLNYTRYSDLYGRGVYADVLRHARAVDPSLDLWVNEGQVLAGERDRAFLEVAEWLARSPEAEGGQPDGLGFMAHFKASSLASPDTLLARLDRFAALVPRLKLTEMDVDAGADEALQADYLRDVLTVAFSHPAVEGVIMWGFWAGQHWRPDAALWRQDWSVKPAGQAWQDLIYGRWWTQTAGQTGADGTFSTPAFLGDYTVTVEAIGETQALPAVLARGGKELVVHLGGTIQGGR